MPTVAAKYFTWEDSSDPIHCIFEQQAGKIFCIFLEATGWLLGRLLLWRRLWLRLWLFLYFLRPQTDSIHCILWGHRLAKFYCIVVATGWLTCWIKLSHSSFFPSLGVISRCPDTLSAPTNCSYIWMCELPIPEMKGNIVRVQLNLYLKINSLYTCSYHTSYHSWK